jgi:spore germination protein
MGYERIFSMRVLSFILCAIVLLPFSASAQNAQCAFSKDLRFGNTGSDVTRLQTFLKNQGYFTAASSPRFGNATLASVRAFQKAHGIATTGTVGPLTRAKINALCTSSASNSASVSAGDIANIVPAQSNSVFEVTGWIPYWRQATGTADTVPHLSKMTEVNPFTYTLKSDGTLADNGPMTGEPWLSFNSAAKAQGVRVIPTIMTSNRTLVHSLLSDGTKRAAFVNHIGSAVESGGYDGIDIDFEGKAAETKDHFSLFLKELKVRLGSKWLMCTIETRIPNEDRYFGTSIPADAGVFANDLKAIGAYCDRVRIMTYDQQNIDLKLAHEAGSRLYAANGDPAWVEKVVALMSRDIPRSKILIGVPTYGYEYAVTTYEGGEHAYDILWTFNPGHAVPQKGISAISLSEKYRVTPERTYWGELAFTYVPVDESIVPPVVSQTPVPALAASAAAALFANTYKSNMTYRYVVWPDEVSTQQKIDLARRLGVRGISIFKLDGGQDPDIWNVLTGVKQ